MVKPRKQNTEKHMYHLATLNNGNSTEGQALVAYGSKQFKDAILHILELSRQKGNHLEDGTPKNTKDIINYFGNPRISKKERTNGIQQATQSGGSWKHFWHGFKKGFTSVINRKNLETAATLGAALL